MKTCFKHQKFSSFSLSETDYFSQSASGYPVNYKSPVSVWRNIAMYFYVSRYVGVYFGTQYELDFGPDSFNA